jgi:hypothetical protein
MKKNMLDSPGVSSVNLSLHRYAEYKASDSVVPFPCNAKIYQIAQAISLGKRSGVNDISYDG